MISFDLTQKTGGQIVAVAANGLPRGALFDIPNERRSPPASSLINHQRRTNADHTSRIHQTERAQFGDRSNH
jgi:hypothetical protein